MTAKHKPATPLPWRLFALGPKLRPSTIEVSAPPPAKLGELPCVVGWSGFDSTDLRASENLSNARYLVHAANQYPRLVEALLGMMGLVQLLGHAHDSQATKNHRYQDAEALLLELGETS